MSSPRERKKQTVGRVMRGCGIETVSSAVLNTAGEITPMTLCLSKSSHSVDEKKEEPKCGAASLSKPVFAYLVLKLIEENNSNKEMLNTGKFKFTKDVSEFNLDTPLYKILPELSRCPEKAYAEKLTARMVLSHQTGIPHSHQSGPPSFDFEPGTGYAYNGLPYFYLQIALERLTGSTLEDLAKAFVFDPCDMNPSTFLRSGHKAEDAKNYNPSNDLFSIDLSKYPTLSANSLTTTASGYMNFIKHWLSEKSLLFAFEPQISMTKDKWACDMNVPMLALEKLASGLGWALQTNDNGKVVRAFHWADMNSLRADIAIDLEKNTAVVFFADNENGHVLADHIISPEVELTHGLTFMSEKLGFAVRFEKHWEKRQTERMTDIGNYLNGSLDISNAAMAESTFGQSSHTAKMLAEQQTDSDHSSGSTYVTPSPLSTKLKPRGFK